MRTSITQLPAEITGAQMVAGLQPAPQFAHVSFESYQADPEFPSQSSARDALATMVAEISKGSLRRVVKKVGAKGIYLDGGFGVGKTHLLAAAYHAAVGPKAFGTFIQYTSIVGALGFHQAVEQFRGYRLLCIDEFELDDPGDTLIMVKLLGELAAGGTSVVATSNTPPGALGTGRFAAKDFLREIEAIASLFSIYRIEGKDYRRRNTTAEIPAHSDTDIDTAVAAVSDANQLIADDNFGTVIAQLRQLHPVKYQLLAAAVSAVVWRGVHPLEDQNDALRLVAFIDRLYDAQVPIFASGESLQYVYPADMLAGGFQKKYQRSLSRLSALDDLAFRQSLTV